MIDPRTPNIKSLIEISSKPVAFELDVGNTQIVTNVSMIKRVEKNSKASVALLLVMRFLR